MRRGGSLRQFLVPETRREPKIRAKANDSCKNYSMVAIEALNLMHIKRQEVFAWVLRRMEVGKAVEVFAPPSASLRHIC